MRRADGEPVAFHNELLHDLRLAGSNGELVPVLFFLRYAVDAQLLELCLRGGGSGFFLASLIQFLGMPG